MPRYSEPENTTPFAQVLIDYMWNQRPRNRPPMGAAQLAARIGASKQNVSNWIFRGSVPPLEHVLIVLAKLDIPLRTLYDAYKRAGLSVPRFDASDTNPPVISASSPPLQSGTGRRQRQTKVPLANLPDSEAPEPMPLMPYTTPHTAAPVRDVARESAEEWDKVIAQTAKSLRDAGMSQQAVDGAIAALRDRRSGALPEQPNTSANTSANSPEQATEPEQPEQQQPEQKQQAEKQRPKQAQHASGKSR